MSKANRLLSREARRQVSSVVNKNMSLIRPKPWYMPKHLWKFLIFLVIKHD